MPGRIGRRALLGFVGILALGAASIAAPGMGGALAAGTGGWGEGCSYRHPSGMFGNGTAIEAEYCARLRNCQALAEQGRDHPATGCMGFAPSQQMSQAR
jgi:hypothetical protein